MYYHPAMFEWANGKRTVATCREFIGVWLDGVARQQQAHAGAVSTFFARQAEGLRVRSQARDTAQFAAGLLSCGATEPHGFASLSARLGAIVVETHRKLGELMGSHSDEMMKSLVELAATEEKPLRTAANGGRGAGRRRWRPNGAA